MAAQNVVVFGFWQREEGNKIELVSFAKVLWGDRPTMDKSIKGQWLSWKLTWAGTWLTWLMDFTPRTILWGMWGKSDSTEVLNEASVFCKAKKALQLFDGVGVGQFTSPASLA